MVLEVVNFLVLVWLLKRFLYKPLLNVIAQRKAAIDKTLADAESGKTEAKELHEKYQSRLADWEIEKTRLRRELTGEIQAQRERLTAELQRALAQEREKETVLAQRRLSELETQASDKGTHQGLQFTARLLERIASPELEAKFLKVALDDLPHLSEAQKEALQTACHDPRQVIKVASAFPLAAPQREAINQALKSATQHDLASTFHEDPALVAGVRINVGPWTLRANLQDELGFFAERVRDGS
jgi:F-type H+-transporting ATPase subunit b